VARSRRQDEALGDGIDATAGALAFFPRFPVGARANACSIFIDPTNQFLYLTPMSASPLLAENRPDFLATF
jgi:hypothetical protein